MLLRKAWKLFNVENALEMSSLPAAKGYKPLRSETVSLAGAGYS